MTHRVEKESEWHGNNERERDRAKMTEKESDWKTKRDKQSDEKRKKKRVEMLNIRVRGIKPKW